MLLLPLTYMSKLYPAKTTICLGNTNDILWTTFRKIAVYVFRQLNRSIEVYFYCQVFVRLFRNLDRLVNEWCVTIEDAVEAIARGLARSQVLSKWSTRRAPSAASTIVVFTKDDSASSGIIFAPDAPSSGVNVTANVRVHEDNASVLAPRTTEITSVLELRRGGESHARVVSRSKRTRRNSCLDSTAVEVETTGGTGRISVMSSDRTTFLVGSNSRLVKET